jgi:hypothetical protein
MLCCALSSFIVVTRDPISFGRRATPTTVAESAGAIRFFGDG